MSKTFPKHPGEILLKEFLEPYQIQQRELVEHLGWTYARLNEIINQKRGVTVDSAMSFAECFGTTVEFWLDIQRNFDISNALATHQTVKPFQRYHDAVKKTTQS